MIAPFRGRYFFLSNFSPAVINYEGIWYSTSEHAYQAAKTLDKSKRFAICRLKKAYMAKNEGGILTLRPDWDNIKIEIMTDIIRLKFSMLFIYIKYSVLCPFILYSYYISAIN